MTPSPDQNRSARPFGCGRHFTRLRHEIDQQFVAPRLARLDEAPRRAILAAFGQFVDGDHRRGRARGHRKFASLNPEQWA
jgi:hypothetical protein